MRGHKASRWILFLSWLAVSLGSSRAQPSSATGQTRSATSALSPQTLPTPEQLGDSLVAHQRYQAAIAAYSESSQMTAHVWNKMGIAYQMMFNSKDATRCYKESLKLDPSDAEVLNNLATVYASLKQYGQADRMYRKAIKLDPKSAIFFKNYGTNLLAEHKYNKGWEAYQQALAIDPQIFADHNGPTVENPSNVQERGAMNYYMAAGCARAGYTDCALQYLRMALDEGFTTRKKVEADSQFASLRDDPGFQKLLAEEHSQ
ncbi:MAG: tetratricopeptide repeat protein [Terracidiphilus sp.]|jgi:Tfp pilus assembly protein PilF